MPRIGIFGEPHSHYWTLLRGAEAVAVVSMEGRLHRRTGPAVDLEAEYIKNGRRMRRTSAKLLREWF